MNYVLYKTHSTNMLSKQTSLVNCDIGNKSLAGRSGVWPPFSIVLAAIAACNHFRHAILMMFTWMMWSVGSLTQLQPLTDLSK